jgi:hypothetical protein
MYTLHGSEYYTQGGPNQRLQFVQVLPNRWPGWLAACLVASAALGFILWGGRVRKPPPPTAAVLPASARILLQPFRKDTLDLDVAAQADRQYRIAMQEGASLVFSWTASHGPVPYQFAGQGPGRASEAHGAFVARSAGWYRWRWSNPTADPIRIHLKLSGYYDPDVSLPYDK